MKREWLPFYSQCLERELHVLVHGHTGVPLLAFPCQDSMCDNWENFQMPEVLSDYIEDGQIQIFCVDTVDQESWSDVNGDKEHRAWVQEQYYYFIVNELYPFIREINGTDNLPITTGFSLGATHALITFLRRPELFAGVIALSGCYDALYFYDGWCNSLVYNNSPVHFIQDMPEDHPYIDLYNEKKIVLCVGQGAWEDEGRRTTAWLKRSFEAKGIHAWCDFWGEDVNHDWDWWRIQIRYFLPKVLWD